MVGERKKISDHVVAEILETSRRRCCICVALRGDMNEKKGQIAHLDRNPSHNDPDNLAFLCLEHHDQYDSRPSQSKGFTPEEVKRYRMILLMGLGYPIILAPQFEPLFRRVMFIINIDKSSFDAQDAEAQAKELVLFVSVLEMGSFYGKEIARL